MSDTLNGYPVRPAPAEGSEATTPWLDLDFGTTKSYVMVRMIRGDEVLDMTLEEARRLGFVPPEKR